MLQGSVNVMSLKPLDRWHAVAAPLAHHGMFLVFVMKRFVIYLYSSSSSVIVLKAASGKLCARLATIVQSSPLFSLQLQPLFTLSVYTAEITSLFEQVRHNNTDQGSTF